MTPARGAAPVRKLVPAEAEVVLRDGSTVHVRPTRPDDAEALYSFLAGLSTASRAMRFFSAGSDLEAAARWAGDVDSVDRLGVVAVRGTTSRIVGHAACLRTAESRAEAAFEVADELQGLGIGTLLLAHLADAAARVGIEVFELLMLPDNRAMADVVHESGFPTTARSEPGLVRVEIPTSLSPAAVARFEARERTAAAAALRSVLSPRSVAVVGASDEPGSIGGAILRNLLDAGFPGPIHPVNRRADTVHSLPAHPTMRDVPEPVELAVVAVPAASVAAVAEDCAAEGVRALVVVSAGFAELGDEGRRRQDELLQTCRAAGMRLVGPNCLGVLSTDPARPLNATFAPAFPDPGGVGFFSQSGGLGLAIVDRARELGIGLSAFVSAGNKADVSANDLLGHWEVDERTDVIVLYLESFGNAHRFARVAGRVGRSKPIIAVKSGRSRAGARATGSHTGALVGASDLSLDALFRQAGVIRVDTLSELFDVTSLLSAQPAPAGRRVAIVTNAGGPAILCADACEAAGLEVVDLPGDLRERLAALLPAEASTANPVDMLAGAGEEEYRRVLGEIADSGAADALVAIYIPVFGSPAAEEAVAGALTRVAEGLPAAIALASVFMSEGPGRRILRKTRPLVPAYPSPEEAGRALARAADYGVWRGSPEGSTPAFADLRRTDAATLISRALAAGGGWLAPEAVAGLVRCYGLPLVEARFAATPTAAGRLAAESGGPVALKAVAPGLEHKSDAGGVELGLRSAAAVQRAAGRMRARVREAGHELEGFLVQPMSEGGVEMLVGVVQDEVFGPVVACGAGGTATELLDDVAVRITPLTDRDAHEMVRSLATHRLLTGYRDAPVRDVDALEEIVLRVSAMVDAHPEIAELDLNPVIVRRRGAAIVDARVRVAPARPAPPWPAIDRET